MTNSSRKITRGVRVGAKTYVPGMEDELNDLLSSEEVKRLSGKGHIEGKWSGHAPEPEAEKVEGEKSEKATKKEK